jgi:formylglycine-generating enzyme required for sulfatase activity
MRRLVEFRVLLQAIFLAGTLNISPAYSANNTPDEGSNRVQVHYSKLKKLNSLDKATLPDKLRVKLWQDFIILFPYDNPYLAEAKRNINSLSKRQSSPATKEKSLDQKIKRRFTFLMDLEQKTIPLEKRLGAWSGFVRDFPIENPKLDYALAKINRLRTEQKRLADKKVLAKEATQKKKVAQIEEHNRLAEEKWLAEETARREEERVAEQKLLAEKEARIKEQKRLAEEKGLAEDAAQSEKVTTLAEQKQPPPPAEEESLDQTIDNQFALLMGLDQKTVSLEKKMEAWSGFLMDFPINNPKFDFALAKLTEIRTEQKRLAKEKGLISGKSNEVEIALLEPPPSIKSPRNLTKNEGMALIPAGKYVYGEPGYQETRALNAFYMDVQEVAQKDYEQLMGKNPSRFKGDNLPVERVTWQEAKEYCERIGKRLPTGKEWEKAARAGTSSLYYWGTALEKNNANCNDCGSQWDGLQTAPVRSFPPNAWKLYDMSGNVWEWVDESHNKIFKVLRGGSWMDDASFISTAASYFILPENKSHDIGFRCAKVAPVTR